MFMKHSDIAPAHMADILRAAEAATRAIPPAFPLDATVAVNPFLGQIGTDLASTAARLDRAAGVRLTLERADYAAAIAEGRITDADLKAALDASTAKGKPAGLAKLKAALDTAAPAPQALPTVAELAATETGTDWPSVFMRTFGLWAAGHFDRGQALWSPTPGRSAYAAWRDWAIHDLTPEIAGLSGFCAHVADAPDTPERAILRAADRLGITGASAESAFHHLLMELGGWAQHARWLLWQAEMAGETDATTAELLAIRLVWEEAILGHVPQVSEPWASTVAEHAEPAAPSTDHVLDTILQEAAERAFQRSLSEDLTGAAPATGRPKLQAAFCIDVRSEVYRRALESLDSGIATIGFAGFFGLPLAHTAQGSDVVESRLPVLLNPGLETSTHGTPEDDMDLRITTRANRAWGRFRQAAVSSFAFVEAAGPIYGAKLIKDALGQVKPAKSKAAPRVDTPLDAKAKADTATAVLTAMGLTKGHAPVVLLLGHGAQVTNNPHESAYHCGACGGHTGEVSARVLANLLNDAEARAGLAERGIEVPADTVFVAGLHDTTTDRITLYSDSPKLAPVRRWLDEAAGLTRAERATRIPGASGEALPGRARNWAEVRPEWGLAGCAAFIAAPRAATAHVDLKGRAFLHSYDWQADDGFGTLELIITAPVVVASWISLQYYGSSVAPEAFGGGNKLIHNVVGGLGVVEGNGGTLRPGLPWQAIHDGHALVHEPLRLSVMIEAPTEAIDGVLEAHPGVRDLFDNGWLHLFALKDGKVAQRYRPGLVWEAA